MLQENNHKLSLTEQIEELKRQYKFARQKDLEFDVRKALRLQIKQLQNEATEGELQLSDR